jgi:hypothetical protein
LLNPLTRPMAMKACERGATFGTVLPPAGGSRAHPKTCYFTMACTRVPPPLYTKAHAMFTRGHPRAHEKSSGCCCCSRLTDTLQLGIGGLEKSGFDTDHLK